MIRFLVVFSVLSTAIFGQSDSTVIASYHRNAIYSAAGSFTDLDNWNAGGENSSNISLLLRENWTKKGENFTTVHLLEGNYGLSRQAGILTKNADKLEFTTTLTGSPKTTDWNLSGQLNVRTQFAPGFAKGDTTRTPISTFGAPVYGQYSFGIGNNSWEHWQVFLSPFAGKSTTVFDETLREKAAFGVDTGATWRFEAGAKITLNYTQQLTDEFEVTAKSDLFFNYWESISATDLNLDIIAIYKIRKALSFNAHFQLIRDIDQIDAWQRRSVLGVGLAYTLQN
ncbi:MAG: DUF3078 domain-containing protein [Cryomorphaceae bacterium]|nr:DUF3078 domain-containing protein [Cryomorphaceae bacterium]MBL6681943.1 DUF3078 domain-containing protein [Cryomorphaceae bacterium]MBL6867712.1 DUF3078 domain-containing protein [Cryomorphaceae bacterium]